MAISQKHFSKIFWRGAISKNPQKIPKGTFGGHAKSIPPPCQKKAPRNSTETAPGAPGAPPAFFCGAKILAPPRKGGRKKSRGPKRSPQGFSGDFWKWPASNNSQKGPPGKWPAADNSQQVFKRSLRNSRGILSPRVSAPGGPAGAPGGPLQEL